MICLKMVKGAEMAEGVHTEQHLPEPLQRFVIGRDPAAHWPIPDRTLALSARHCEVMATPAGVVLRDLSTNGTFVNGAATRLAGEHRLHDGDRFELGPYTIVVHSGLPRAAAAAATPRAAPDAAPVATPVTAPGVSPPPSPAAAPRSPSVESTAPLRGGDPAAMLAHAGLPREGLTAILRAAPPAEDASVEITKIRLAPKGAMAPAARPAGSTPMPEVGRPTASASTPERAPGPPSAVSPTSSASAPSSSAPAPAPATAPAPAPSPPPATTAGLSTPPPPSTPPAAGPAETLLATLAASLGLPADALAGRDAAQVAAQVGALARTAVTVLRHLLELQAQERRLIGSRAPALQAVRDVNPLRLAATPEAALQALLAPDADPAAPLQRAAAELAAHPQRLLAAFRTATQRLGQEIAPDALQAALQASLPAHDAPPDPARQQASHARLWALYTQVWQGMGLAPGQPWPEGFAEAALLHLAAAYDVPGRNGSP